MGPIAANALAASNRAEDAQHLAMLCIVACVAVTAGALGNKYADVPVSPVSESCPASILYSVCKVEQGFFPHT
jgi:hypothetical protein